MYSPPHYREDRREVADDVIGKFPFATLISVVSREPTISHIPLLMEGDFLIGHFARANPHWRSFSSGLVTAVFNGPHAYISPAWYAPAEDNVPTWNYVTVHVSGAATVVDDENETMLVMNKMVAAFETKYGTNWVLPENDEIKKLARAIVAFRMKIEKVDAKFKLSQNRDPRERATVIRELARFGDEGRAVADYMKQFTLQK